jgi:RNA polymerase sigma-70 factor (ECF subfamily)
LTEVEIIEGCRLKNQKAERLLWESYAPKLFAICVRHLGNTHDAEEVLQESFIKIYKGIHQYTFTGSFEGWLKRIVINTALTHLRLNRKLKMEADLMEVDANVHWHINPLVQLEAKELLQLLNRLPQNLATILNLFSIDGFTHQEIANMLHISEGASRVMLHRAKTMLMEKIKQVNKEGDTYGKR